MYVVLNVVKRTPSRFFAHSAEGAAKKQPTLRLKNEVEERERRKRNIVVHNLAESTSTKPAQRQLDDSQRVNEMIVEAMRIEDIKAVKSTRMGGLRRDGKPRVLLVALDGDRTRLLRKAKYVRMYEEWAEIFIDPDRTPQERRLHSTKRAELKAQREAEECGELEDSFYSAAEEPTVVPSISDLNLTVGPQIQEAMANGQSHVTIVRQDTEVSRPQTDPPGTELTSEDKVQDESEMTQHDAPSGPETTGTTIRQSEVDEPGTQSEDREIEETQHEERETTLENQ